MLRIRCRLNELLAERKMSLEELAKASHLSLSRVVLYCDEKIDNVYMQEVAALMTGLGCDSVSDLFEPVTEESVSEESLIYEDDWETPCAASKDGKHIWYKDVTVCSNVYQEYYCTACGHRFSFIL